MPGKTIDLPRMISVVLLLPLSTLSNLIVMLPGLYNPGIAPHPPL
jgi:hypothetical protein